jgi:transcriptional regulator with XRE-family HTH domain
MEPALLIKNVGRRIAERRVALNLTQPQMATLAGVSLPYWARLERGSNLTLKSLAEIASVLKLEVIELLRPPRKGPLPKVQPKQRRK